MGRALGELNERRQTELADDTVRLSLERTAVLPERRMTTEGICPHYRGELGDERFSSQSILRLIGEGCGLNFLIVERLQMAN